VEEVPKPGSGKTDFSALNKLAGELTQGAKGGGHADQLGPVPQLSNLKMAD
jgi:hypothetical protein